MANEEKDIEKLSAKKVTLSIILKLGSGVILLSVLGYAASWAFVTLNSLQDVQAKNSEKIDMVIKGVEKDREDKAQWKQIMVVREKSIDNEVEIKVLRKLYGFHIGEILKKHRNQKVNIPPVGPLPLFVLPEEKADVKIDKLYEKLQDRDRKKIETVDDFRKGAMQQMQQNTTPQKK